MNKKKILIGAGVAALVAGTAGTFAVAAGSMGFGGGMMGFGPRGGPGHGMMLMQVVKQFDGNKDAKISKDEVTAFEKDVLAKYDANKDGKLTLAEFEQAFDAFVHPMAVRAFQHFDPDGDAAVTAAEFAEPFDHMMTMMDRNKDGVIDEKDRPQGGHGGWMKHGMGRQGGGHGWFGQGDGPDGPDGNGMDAGKPGDQPATPPAAPAN